MDCHHYLMNDFGVIILFTLYIFPELIALAYLGHAYIACDIEII